MRAAIKITFFDDNGGGSTLTPEGKEWLKKYEQYREACIQAGSKLYMEIFSD